MYMYVCNVYVYVCVCMCMYVCICMCTCAICMCMYVYCVSFCIWTGPSAWRMAASNDGQSGSSFGLINVKNMQVSIFFV